VSKHSANVRRALKRSEGSSLYKKPDYYKEEVEELDEKMISVQNSDGHLLKVASQFKDIYKKHGYKPLPGTRVEEYEADDGPLTEDQLEQIQEVAAWQRKEGKSESGGLNRKGIESYRRENPGSKLSMAVTTKPSKLKAGSKAANRRKSFCARMGGMKRRLTSAKTARDPDSTMTDAFGRLRIVNPVTLFESTHRFSDNGLWVTSNTASNSSYTFVENQSMIAMTVGTTANAEVARETTKIMSYQPGKSLLIMSTFVMNEPKANVRQRVGYFGQSNGIYLENDGTTN